jgi:hypothetical protein
VGADVGTVGRVALVPKRLQAAFYVDPGHRIADTTLVVATGRSGSTWLAEIVNDRNGYRVVFEPFRHDRVRKARAFRRGQYIDPDDQHHPLAGAIDDLLAGRVRTWWTDSHNHRRLVGKRIVKEVRITNLLPWIRARHPELRIVYGVRDPIAVARSWLELGWGDDLGIVLAHELLLEQFPDLRGRIREIASRGEALERHVLRWCLENAIPFHQHEALGIHLVSYERLVAEPESEARRLFAYLGRDDAISPDAMRRPSATAGFPRTRSVEFTPAQRARAEEIVSLFGLAAATARPVPEPGRS